MSAAVLSFVLVGMTACGSKTREVPLRGTFLVEGQLALSETVAQKVKINPPNFSWVDKNGIRQPLTQVNFDSNTGKFSFDFRRENLIRRMGYSQPELTALMGWARPLERLSAQGYEQNETGFIRLEAYSEVTTGNSGELAFYTQKIAGLPMSASFSTNKNLILSAEPIPTTKVGVIRVNVKDSTGVPISGALVSVVPLNVTGGKNYDLKPYDLRLQSLFTPTGILTNAQGSAQAWPIPMGTDKTSKFQISVSHPNYCTQISAPALHDVAAQPVDVVLAACTETQLANQDLEWDVAFPSSLFVLSEPRGTLPAGTGYTNQEQVELQFVNKSATLRGLTVQIHEGENTDAPIVSTQEFPTFANTLMVDLPATFANGTTASGRFLINIISRLSDDDKAAGRKGFTKTLTGNKGVFRVDPARQTDFDVLGHNSVSNLLSGQEGSTFTVRYNQCRSGYKIGVVITPEGRKDPTVNYVPCSSAGNTFALKDVFKGFTKQAGRNVIQFFRTDEFQNKSTDDSSVNKLNYRDIEIDYGSPNPAGVTLGSLGAIVAEGTTIPPLESSLTNVQLKRSEVGKYFFTFTKKDDTTSNCEFVQPIPVQDVDPPDSLRGRTVGQVYIGTVKSKSEMLNSAVACSTSGFRLSPQTVTFPSVPTAAAKFDLTLVDTAGNYASSTVSIPACTNPPSTPTEKVCWQNE